METELQSQLSKILEIVLDSLQDVKDFSVNQLPDVAQQYITYGIWTSVFSVVFVFAISVVLAIINYKFFKHAQYLYTNNRNNGGFFIVALISFIMALIFLPLLYENISKLVLVLTAPKVWLLVELKQLIS